MTKARLTKLALLCVGAAIAMYLIGENNSKLTEFRDVFWIPLPLALIAGAAATRAKS